MLNDKKENNVKRNVQLTLKELAYLDGVLEGTFTGPELCRKLRENPNQTNILTGKTYLKVLVEKAKSGGYDLLV